MKIVAGDSLQQLCQERVARLSSNEGIVHAGWMSTRTHKGQSDQRGCVQSDATSDVKINVDTA